MITLANKKNSGVFSTKRVTNKSSMINDRNYQSEKTQDNSTTRRHVSYSTSKNYIEITVKG